MSCIQNIYYAEGAAQPTAHHHNTYQMLYVCGGAVRLYVDRREYAVVAPSVVFLSNLETHALSDMTEDYCRYVIDIQPEVAFARLADAARLLSPFIDRLPGFSHVLPVNDQAQAVEMLCRSLQTEKRMGDFHAGENALLQCLLQTLFRRFPEYFPYREQANTPVVQKIKRRFSVDPATDVSLAELAAEYHISESHLSHSFKKATGYSIGRYQMLCRLALAKEMLLTSDRPVTAVCSECGFSDLSNFTRYFRREFGCSPTRFRHQGSRPVTDNGH